MKRPKILIIYTGGTIGMIKNENGVLLPFSLDNLLNDIPLLKMFPADIHSVGLDNLIDSSDADIGFWLLLNNIIADNYDIFDGFVILHGSDTMAYTASALSFLLENLSKPVILTGSQLPIGLLRTDGRENIIASIELACMQKNGKPLIQEVCLYFEDHLYRGNRTNKYSAENFDAFISPNYPLLANVGTEIKVFEENFLLSNNDLFVSHKNLCNEVAIIKLFPGIQSKTIKSITEISGLKGIVLETYGSGNAPTNNDIINCFKEAIAKGIIILNVTQCTVGKVQQGKYETSTKLREIGIVSGGDMTTEAALTKLMFLLGKNYTREECIKILTTPLRGEMSY
ncbi:MAG: asparaginase [Bacteroidales bacterium]|nr:asparaginase [Bacteroidales bacterium]